ncbi:MAG: hypothetical protein JWM82_2277, partial [Myxococcales bacterium]|nr:hypothetical protein [Myxococcales bacterium]
GAGANAGSGGAGANAGSGGTAGGSAGAAVAGAGGSSPAPLAQEIHWYGTRDVDLLFMVDNSASMTPLQNKLRANFPAFMNVLKGLPLPNVHIAVVSSDLGAGITGAPGCTNTGGDQGKFQFAPKDPTVCANAQLNPGQTFLSNIGGATNYTGDISDAFSCIAALGQGGCGLEHQLASVLRALGADGSPAPAENTGFLRANALLAVVLITNEDDCSAPRDSMVFTDTSKYVSDPLGPLTSYRCNYVGHLCDGHKLPRDAAGGPYQTCVSAEDGVLLNVADVVAALKTLKSDPNQVLVSALTGPPTPYVVNDDNTPTNDDPTRSWPLVRHSCTQADGTYADPSVRISQLLEAFGANGVFNTICADSFTPALQNIAGQIGKRVASYQCLATAGTSTDCTFVDHVLDVTGARVDTPVPACATNGGAAPCWALVSDARCGTTHLVDVHRATGAALPNSTTVTCRP